MPGGDASAAFFEQGLVVVDSHTSGLHEVAGQFCESRAKDKFFDEGVLLPEVKGLDEGFSVGVAIVELSGFGIELSYAVRDGLVEEGEGGFAQDLFEFDVSIALVEVDLLLGDTIGLLQFINNGLGQG